MNRRWIRQLTLLAAALGATAPHAGALDLLGPDPGQYGIANTFTVEGATPGGTVRIVVGDTAGATPVPGCGGAVVDISSSGLFVVLSAEADPDGVAVVSQPIPPEALDRTFLFQAVDQDACSVSPSTSYTFVRHPLDDELRWNEIQVRGTHNSYHIAPLIPFDDSHRYTHLPLDEQLEDQGVRAFELDVHRTLTGWQVYHIVVIDALSTCRQFDECLEVVKGWSDTHPSHVPIMIWIEAKDDAGGLPIDDLDPVDDIIRSVFPPEQLFTPDDLQAGYGSIRERLDDVGWPTLGEVRGQVMFILLDTGEKAETYTSGYTTLAGRAMFANAEGGQLDAPWAAVRKINDPTAAADHLAALDAGLLTAANICNADETDEQCTSDLDAGKANGVVMLKDDFPGPVAERSYFLDLPDGTPARCNEVTATSRCNSLSIEDLP